MGIKFLKHINRTKAVAFVIDLTSEDPFEVYKTLEKELNGYAPDLAGKRKIIVGTKNDLPGTEEGVNLLHKFIKDTGIVSVSSYTRSGLKDLIAGFEKITE